jgi:hypothetical protein
MRNQVLQENAVLCASQTVNLIDAAVQTTFAVAKLINGLFISITISIS